MNQNPYLSFDRQVIGDCYTSNEVWENLRKLTDEFGSRFGGTEGERMAADFLRDALSSYGLQNVTAEPFEYLGWRRGEAMLEVLSPVSRTIPCISLPHCPPGVVEADLIDMQDGSPKDFDSRAAEISGKIVLTTSAVTMPGVTRWIHRGEKLGRSILADAAGFIFVNHYPGFGPPTGGIGHSNKPALIPGIGMSLEDGTFLQRLVSHHGTVRVRLTTRDAFAPMTSWNVYGDLPGTTAEILMLGCHYDGHDIAQGAQDPASGTVAVLEAARLLAKFGGKTACTVRFMFWGVEEIGLLGSRAYAKAHEEEMDAIRFYFNLDSAGAVEDKGVVLNEWPELAPLFKSWAAEMALPFLVGQSIHAHSDHFPFLMAGVPTGGMEQVKRNLSGRGYGHTAYDTLDKVNLRDLREASTMAARLALRIANETDWPAARRSSTAVQALFDSPEYQEEAKFRAAIAEKYA